MSTALTVSDDLAGSGSAPAAVSMHVPRLADFRFGYKASLISPLIVAGAVRALEGAMIGGLGLGIALAYVDEPGLAHEWAYPLAIILATAAALSAFEVLGLYRMSALAQPLRILSRLVAGWGAAFAALLVAMFLLKASPELSRVWALVWFATGSAALMLSRAFTATLVRRWQRQGRITRRAVVYGGGPAAEELLKRLDADQASDIRILGVFDERGDERTGELISGYPHIGNVAELIAFSRKTRIDMVILTLPMAADKRLTRILRRLSVLPADVRLAAAGSELRFASRTYSYVGSQPMIDLLDKPITDWGIVAKWLFDKLIAIFALIVLAPVMAAVAAAIKLDSRGPVLFRQKRYGFNNELIEVFKFRSMYTDKADAGAAKLVTKDDPRVTKVGRIIRKTSLDELPQLFNVILGSLSLVGPRPHAVQAKAADRLYGEVVDGYFARHKVKPGITGWAQINGWRGETDTEEKIQKRVEHDLWYIENWSVFLDLYILAKTPLSLVTKTENAY